MKILFVIINYKTSQLAIRLVESLQVSLALQPNIDRPILEIVIYCNHPTDENEINLLQTAFEHIDVNYKVISDGNNAGYFGRIKDLQSAISGKFYDIIAYSNSDLVVAQNFISALVYSYNTMPKLCGVIAPSIVSRVTNEDANPKYLKRIPIRKLKFLKKIYESRILFKNYSFIGRLKSKFSGLLRKTQKSKKEVLNAKKIYAPHGALFIFSSYDFFSSITPHRSFMFGEEIHIAESALKKGCEIYYDPSIIVYDYQHASLSTISSDQVREWYLESINHILESGYL